MGFVILHGGAGTWRESKVKSKAVEAIGRCAKLGREVLESTDDALASVVEAVKCMEDSGYLNAGVGSVLDLLGERSLDAGLMTSTGLVGAVAAVRRVKNPILLARFIAENTPHVLLAGERADELGLLLGLEPLPPPPPHVFERYRESLARLLGKSVGDAYYLKIYALLDALKNLKKSLSESLLLGDTVGAVAVDDKGVLAAATSTGGVSLKLPGRVGDSPIPGAGFYSGKYTACSATGYGEVIIREMPCRRLEELVGSGLGLNEAAEVVIREATSRHGAGNMGFIAVDREGRFVVKYNTEAILVAYVGADGRLVVVDKP